MLTIKDNDSVKSVFNTMALNIIKASSDDYTLGIKYDGAKVNENIIKEMEEAYKSMGLDFKLKRCTSELYDIPFNKDIKIGVDSETNNLKYYTLRKNTIVAMDYCHHNELLDVYMEYGYYTKDVRLPQIKENGNLWMTPTVMEYNTMRDSINRSHGNVLVFGCGIGFYQYMCLLRDEVKSVTIVELNEDIIKNFKDNILPQFKKVKGKELNIIHGDAFDYFTDEFLSGYDHVFVDIWLNNEDGLNIYKNLKKKGVTHKSVDYWVEDAMRLEIKRYICVYLKKKLDGNLSSILTVNPKTESDMYFKAIHKVARNLDVTIDSGIDVVSFVNNAEIIDKVLLFS